MKSSIYVILIAIVTAIACDAKKELETRTFYLNSISGNDLNDGLSPETAWKSLQKASNVLYSPGDKLLLSSGCTFYGKLALNGIGSEKKPFIVSSYQHDNNPELPIIDAKGYLAAIQVKNSNNIEISNLEITADAGNVKEEKAKELRYGILVEADSLGLYSTMKLKGLKIHHIFATENTKKDGQNPTSNLGYGIYIQMKNKDAQIKNVLIENCSIEMTGHAGIRIFGAADSSGSRYLENVEIINNQLKHIGGPGIVPARCENVIVRGNITDHSGSSIDPRMHNRGSGIWPWTCNNVLIEKNKFMNAWGKMDSYGAHIDFNCNNVVVQYNLSVNNAGGFVEILGNNNNCSYRYNISINDGYRQKDVNGAVHDGKILWTSGYVGNKNPRKGPFNSYIYNNTVFVKEAYSTRYSFAKTTEGLLIINNIFYLMGEITDVQDHEQKGNNNEMIDRVVFKNNLYQKIGLIPESVIIKDSEPIIGDPQFKNPGGLNPEDYSPLNFDLVKDKGITIEKIPGDKIGLTIGLNVEKDYFGNPIQGLPDLGAIEIQ